MIMNVLLALVKNERDRAFLMIIDYLLKENRTTLDKYAQDCGKRMILNDEQRRELAVLAKPIIKHGFKHVIQIFTPETMMKWYRKYVAREFDSSKSERKLGRPEIPPWVSKKILQMARENRSWGCGRIAGQISDLHYEVSEETVRKILRKHRLEPAPDRDKEEAELELVS